MLFVHRSERADALLGALTTVLAVPVPNPMAREVICVPSRGVERWISQGLAVTLGAVEGATDGVSANIEYPFPSSLTLEVAAKAAGYQPREDPWNNGQAFWALVDAIDANMDTGWMRLVSSQIRSGEDQGRANRVRTVRYVADLFAKYHAQRPDMILAWAQGRDVGPTGAALKMDAKWQAQLWRELRQRLAVASPPERIPELCQTLTDPAVADALDLPARLSVFGLTRLPVSDLQLMQALAQLRDVHLFLLHPSPTLWDAVHASIGSNIAKDRENDITLGLTKHPLLASWGRDSRELQLVLNNARVNSAVPISAIDSYEQGALENLANPTLLRRLQQDVIANRAPIGANYSAIDQRPDFDAAADQSVQVHSCHGQTRQVQVIRDAILHLMDADPTLEPRDIIIMCPDVETFAAEIHATFGSTPQLRVRLADRSVAQTNQFIASVSLLLRVLDSRASATELMSLLATEPVRTRFGFSEEDLDRIRDWVDDAGIRWGIDASHRARWNLADVAANTWQSGIDRLLLGIAMADEDLRRVGGVVPLDDVSSNDILIAGRLSELIVRLKEAISYFGDSFTLEGGLDQLAIYSDQLMAAATSDDWQRREFQRVLDRMRPEPGAVIGSGSQLNFAEFSDLLAAAMAGRPTRENFRTGNITVCTLTPMRSIPHRVVCLLGLDDQTFPRPDRVSGDDLTRSPTFVGDHDGRTEDRQLLLDALLAATDSLVITYAGRDQRTNALKPPAVPLAELLSTIERTVKIGTIAEFVTAHPLQAFDPRNFTFDELVDGRSWSYDDESLAGAQAIQAPAVPRPTFLSKPLDPLLGQQIQLDDLVKFAEHPVKAFVRVRLGLNLDDYNEALPDEFDLEMDSLQTWVVGQQLIDVLSDASEGESESDLARSWFLAVTARGHTPPDELVRLHLREKVFEPASAIARVVRHARQGNAARTVPVRIQLADGRLLLGSVSGVYGNRLITSTFSKLATTTKGDTTLRGKRRMVSWVKLLALAVSDPETEYFADIVAKGNKPGEPTVLRQSAPKDAAVVLESLLALYDRGMCVPLPLYCDTSHAFAGGSPNLIHEKRMTAAWVTSSHGDIKNEDQDPYHQLVLDPVPTVDELLATPGFIECAQQMWDPLLAHEERISLNKKASQ